MISELASLVTIYTVHEGNEYINMIPITRAVIA